MILGSLNNSLLTAVNQIQNMDFWLPSHLDQNTGLWVSDGCIGLTYDLSNTWNFISIGGENSPGLIPIENGVTVTKQIAIDVNKTIGKSGSTNVFHGIQTPKFDINIKIWTPEQWKAFKGWIKIFVPQVGKDPPKSWNCSHPALNFHSIGALQVYGIEGPKHHTAQTKIITLKCIQYIATSKKDATSAAGPPIQNIYDKDNPSSNPFQKMKPPTLVNGKLTAPTIKGLGS